MANETYIDGYLDGGCGHLLGGVVGVMFRKDKLGHVEVRVVSVVLLRRVH